MRWIVRRLAFVVVLFLVLIMYGAWPTSWIRFLLLIGVAVLWVVGFQLADWIRRVDGPGPRGQMDQPRDVDGGSK